MRAYCAGDLHLRLNGPRSDECARCFDWLRTNVADVKPDVFIVPGDFYDRRATPAEERYAQGFLQDVSEGIGGAPILIVGGNHDDYEQLQVLAETKAKGPIVAFSRPGLRIVDGVNVCCVPWPRVAHLASAMPSASIADRREAARAALVDVLRGFGPYDDANPLPSLLALHANVSGSVMDSGQVVSPGEEIALSVADLMEAQPGAVVLSHIHVRQQLVASVPCWYTGSIARCNFGESNGPKGALVYEWTGSEWRVEERNGPARRMLLINSRFDPAVEESIAMDSGEDSDAWKVPGDAEIRLRVEFPSDEREAARAAAAGVRERLLAAGAFSVTVEERPTIVSRTRCASIATARTTAEKLAEWSKAAGVEVPAGAEAKLVELEGSVAP